MSKDRRTKIVTSESREIPPINSEILIELQKKYQHDAFCRDKLRNIRKAKKFLQYFLKPEIQELLDIDGLQIDPESYVDEELKRSSADVVYRIPVKNSDEYVVVFVLIELKTENDHWTVFQLVKYVVRIWDRELKKAKRAKKTKRLDNFLFPMVIPIIFHHGEQRFTAPTELIKLVHVLKGLEPYTLNMKSLLFDVNPLTPKDMPEDLELNTLFMILQAVFRKDVVDRLMAIYQKLRPTFNLPESQEEWKDFLYYATTSAKQLSGTDIENIIEQTNKEGVPKMSALYELCVKNRTEGKAEGIAEGKAVTIMAILRKKFIKVPKRIETEICKMNDPIALESLAVHAAMSRTLKEFSEALK